MKRLILFCVAAICFATGAVAETLVCTVTDVSRDLDPRIGDQIVVTFSSATGRARIDDGFPRKGELPHMGEVGRDTDKILSFIWRQPGMAMKRNPNLVVAYAYRLTVQKANGRGKLSVSGEARFTSVVSARTRCSFAE